MKALGIILVIVGVIALALPFVSFTREEKVLDIGPIEAVKEERETLPLPPIIGGIVLAVGVIILVAGAVGKKS